jgi:carbonic anhydrase
MNLIPLATLAAILFVVGFKLAKPSVFRKMLRQGPDQFVPFMVTVCGIVFTDLLVGISLGMVVAVLVILFENFRLPFEISNVPQERGERVQIALAQQVTFLNKASVLKTLDSIPDDSSVEIDASESVFVHPDVVELIDNFVIGAEAKNIDVVVHGLDHRPHVKRPTGMKVAVTSPSTLKQELSMRTQTKEIQAALTPQRALELLREGNARFQTNLKVNRNLLEQVNTTADGQYPFAVILSCIDSRSQVLDAMIAEGQVGIVGAMYSVQWGTIEFQDMFCGTSASHA